MIIDLLDSIHRPFLFKLKTQFRKMDSVSVFTYQPTLLGSMGGELIPISGLRRLLSEDGDSQVSETTFLNEKQEDG
jgi:hypothetical protein